jgi:hypothetical protein
LVRRIVLRLAISAILVLALAVPAFAQGKPEGTPKGQVEKGPDNANSICSYSGLNDHDINEPPGGQTQSYGQEEVRGPDADKPSDELGRATPGFACNGHLSPYPEAFPPPAP